MRYLSLFVLATAPEREPFLYQKSEIEIRNQKLKSEVGSQKSEVRSGDVGPGKQKFKRACLLKKGNL